MHRINMEMVVDAYNEEERAMGWYYYLEDRLHLPKFPTLQVWFLVYSA